MADLGSTTGEIRIIDKATATINQVKASLQGLKASNIPQTFAASWTSASDQMTKGLGKFRSAFATIAGGGLALAGIEGLSRKVANYGREIQRIQALSGASFETASKLNFMAKLVGASADVMVISMIRLDKQLLPVNGKISAQGRAIQALGIQLKDASGNFLPLDMQLKNISAAFQRSGDKMKFMATVFGNNFRAARFAPIIAQFEELSKQADKVSFPQISQEDIHNFEAFQLRLQLLEISIGKVLLPTLVKLAPAFIFAFGAIALGKTIGGLVNLTKGAIVAGKAIRDLYIALRIFAAGGGLAGIGAGLAITGGAIISVAAASRSLPGAIDLATTSLGDLQKEMFNTSHVSFAVTKELNTQLGGFMGGFLGSKLDQANNRVRQAGKIIGQVYNDLIARGVSAPKAFQLVNQAAMRTAEILGGTSGGFGKFNAALRRILAPLLTTDQALRKNKSSLAGVNSEVELAQRGYDQFKNIIGATSGVVGRFDAVVGTKLHDSLALVAKDLQSSNWQKAWDDFQKGAADAVKQFVEWQSQLADSLNFVKASIGDLSKKQNLSSADIIKTFKQQLGVMKQYRSDWLAVARVGGPAAQSLLQHISTLGQDGAKFLHALRTASAKDLGQIINLFNQGGDAAAIMAGDIAKTLGVGFSDLQKVMNQFGQMLGAFLNQITHTQDFNWKFIPSGIDEAHAQAKSFVALLGKVPKKTAMQLLTPGATLSKKQVDDVATAINKMPGKKSALIKALGTILSKKQIDAVRHALGLLPSRKNIYVTTHYQQVGRPGTFGLSSHTGGLLTPFGPITRMHSGGLLPGEVDIRARLGEFMFQTTAVNFWGGRLLSLMNNITSGTATRKDVTRELMGALQARGMLNAAPGPSPKSQPQGRGGTMSSDQLEHLARIGAKFDVHLHGTNPDAVAAALQRRVMRRRPRLQRET